MQYRLSLSPNQNCPLLRQLSIKNYALIDDLNVTFGRGFTTITGETGAGKSILLGGLSLVLGKRADLSVLQDKDRKCIIEAEFSLENYGLEPFFVIHELDYDRNTILRREILPGGKSRAFINDTPATLEVLSQLGARLVDVHSQHQTLQLTEHDFQLKVIDALASNAGVLNDYKKVLEQYQHTSKELNELVYFQQNAIKEQDYNTFLFNELEAADLSTGMLEELEEQYEQLSNVETIMEQLAAGHRIMSDEQVGILSMMSGLKQATAKLASFGTQYSQLNDRIQSVFLEANDVSEEIQRLHESVEANPQLLETVNAKLRMLFDLRKKHSAADVAELMAIRETLEEKIRVTEHLDEDIAQKKQLLTSLEEDLTGKAAALSERRREVAPGLKGRLEQALAGLGMPNASFKIEVQAASTFRGNGKDDLVFLFSANKGTDYGDLKKVASGGELSRIMLTIKAILAQYEQLPTMMFDEIDTGVSGEISNNMGEIMYQMSKHMQIFSITHLPQVASKGNQHFKVYKEDDKHSTHTKMKALNEDERVVELAEMLGGKSLSESAMAHARELLN
ncbi:MAG TPA: DNA repair protein RecN [Eudoraea sp.]|nr:DNA repair protein RecN [Eudoraea sp.]